MRFGNHVLRLRNSMQYDTNMLLFRNHTLTAPTGGWTRGGGWTARGGGTWGWVGKCHCQYEKDHPGGAGFSEIGYPA